MLSAAYTYIYVYSFPPPITMVDVPVCISLNRIYYIRFSAATRTVLWARRIIIWIPIKITKRKKERKKTTRCPITHYILLYYTTYAVDEFATAGVYEYMYVYCTRSATTDSTITVLIVVIIYCYYTAVDATRTGLTDQGSVTCVRIVHIVRSSTYSKKKSRFIRHFWWHFEVNKFWKRSIPEEALDKCWAELYISQTKSK